MWFSISTADVLRRAVSNAAHKKKIHAVIHPSSAKKKQRALSMPLEPSARETPVLAPTTSRWRCAAMAMWAITISRGGDAGADDEPMAGAAVGHPDIFELIFFITKK